MSDETRLRRKRLIAEKQIEEFEDMLSQHELNLARLDALTTTDQPANFTVLRKIEKDGIRNAQQAIETTKAEIDKLPADDPDET